MTSVLFLINTEIPGVGSYGSDQTASIPAGIAEELANRKPPRVRIIGAEIEVTFRDAVDAIDLDELQGQVGINNDVIDTEEEAD